MSLRGGDPAEIGGYPVEARLGSGGMGTVFLARTSSGRPVAIKLIHQQFAGDEEFRIRFRQEVAAARRVSGAFTAAVVDAAPEAEQPWMATTYIEGDTLAQHIAAAGPLGGTELRRLAIGLAEALRDIHRVGVVHRDLKPSNVVLSPEGPRVIDFGISRAADQQTLTMTGRVIGTPPFMSPEQLQAPRGVGPASDVFSLGTLLVYAATGSGPFDADSPYMTAYQVVHEEPSLGAVPEVLRTVVESCLDKEAAGRPSAGELLVLLRDLPGDLGGPGPTGTRAGRTRDVITEQHDALPTPVPTAGAAPPAEPGTAGSGTSVGRRLRDRWRPVLAAAVAVAAIAGGVAALQPGGPDGDGGGDQAGSVAEPTAPLPKGFKPWQETVVGGTPDAPDELRCVARGDALFCGGGSVVATRVNVRDGSREWTAKSPGVPRQGSYFVGATDDTVLGYRFPAEDASWDPEHEVVALDADDGRELWSAPIGAWSRAVAGRSLDAVVTGSAVLVVDAADSHIEARDVRSGDVTWSTPFPSGTRCTPVQAGRRLLAMCALDGELDDSEVRHPALYPLDRASGKLGRPIAFDGPATLVGDADGDLVLLREVRERTGTVGYDGIVRVDPATREVAYARLKRTYDGTLAVVDGLVYLTAQTGRVTALDPVTGHEKWVRQTTVEGASGPVAGDGVLYFSSATGRVVALAQDDGKVLWSTDPRVDAFTGGGESLPRTILAGRALVVAADENTLFAFDARNPPEPS
ncbi:serine/threonine-protein kinase [Streptomyces sp. BBFR102]|uniref:serine/threonine-protein kinase n=1 Tax=Streptomyces sp. BBFR102 TaxID=3448171 RepID=UPI003F5313DA